MKSLKKLAGFLSLMGFIPLRIRRLNRLIALEMSVRVTRSLVTDPVFESHLLSKIFSMIIVFGVGRPGVFAMFEVSPDSKELGKRNN